MLEYELKRMVNRDIEFCKSEWDKYSFDWERMGVLFEKMMNRYINIIDGFDRGLNVISAYEKKNNSGITYRDNLQIIIKRLEKFRDNGYSNDGLYKEENEGLNIRRYSEEDFRDVRIFLDSCDELSTEEKSEVSDKLDGIETICTSVDTPRKKWEKLRPYVMWLSGKKLVIASHVMPLLMEIDRNGPCNIF
ncbi:hypothetical protein IMSAG049_01076 [Clostridiales bacterium]|nr:hypothetical protein IMSAG049_01076 [Clostridiales bacterium]